MNRYPLWKYVTIVVALLIATLYTLPNFFGEAPAVQVSSGKATIKVDLSMVSRVEQVLAQQGLAAEAIQFDGNSVKARFASTDLQIKARDTIDQALNTDPTNPGHVVALNLLPRTPAWLQSFGAAPMYLGLDLRGGVHFMLQVDMPGALVKRAEAMAGDVRSALREKNLRAIVRREGQAHLTHAAIGFGDVEPPRALDLQDQRVDRIGHPRDGAAPERGLRLGDLVQGEDGAGVDAELPD